MFDRKHAITVLACLAVAAGIPTSSRASNAGKLSGKALVHRLIANAGGKAAAATDGVFKLEVRTEETTSDGRSHKKQYTAWVNPTSWIQRRLQLNPKVLLGFDGKAGWALVNGKEDTRPQTPLQAQGNINRMLFAQLLPFSLDQKGIVLGSPKKGTWENKPAVDISLDFPRNFFYNPVMETTWTLVLDPSMSKVLGVEFKVTAQYVRLGAEGMRYYLLKRTSIDGVTLPTKLLAVALDQNGEESGHVKTYDIHISKVPGDFTLFLSPKALAALNEEGAPPAGS